VMYAGQIVETGLAEDVIKNPAHPYTQLLIESSPQPTRRIRGEVIERGEPPSMLAPPAGCRFHARCPFVMDICKTQVPPPIQVSANHTASCWLHSNDHASVASAASTEGTIT
jgi:peptide/nickel transport system ATP-binding protein